MKKNNKKGFTLVELVIVVAVMAILVAVAIPTVSSITSKATSSVNDSNARTIESMLKLAEADKDGGTLAESDVWDAINEAKLGIETGTFTYDVVNGTVKSATPTSTSASVYSIKFTTTNGKTTLEVKGASSESAELTGVAVSVSDPS